MCVEVVATKNALHFLPKNLDNEKDFKLYTEEDEWSVMFHKIICRLGLRS